MTNFDHVWISTPEHLEECTRIMKSTGFFGRAFGKNWIPEGFPVLQASRIFPNGFFASGKVTIDEGKLSFKAAYPGMGSMFSVQRIDLKMEFILSREQVKSVESWRQEKAYIPFFKFDWVKVNCDPSILEGEFLMAHGHKDMRPKRTTKQTAVLFEALRRL